MYRDALRLPAARLIANSMQAARKHSIRDIATPRRKRRHSVTTITTYKYYMSSVSLASRSTQKFQPIHELFKYDHDALHLETVHVLSPSIKRNIFRL